MRLITTIILLVLAQGTPLASQEIYDFSHQDFYELKAGKVTNGQAMVLGFAGKFYGTNNFTVVPEILLLGGPFLCGTLRYDFPLEDGIRVTPQLGIGGLPLPLLFTTIGIAGFDVSYHPSSNYYLFLEVRTYVFAAKDIDGIGSGSFEITDIDSRNPIVISAGIAF